MSTGATDPPNLAATFQHRGVAAAYEHRPTYPSEVFDVLLGLITDQPRNVLDLGAGEGALARPLAGLVDHVDALDISAEMMAAGRRRPGGGQPNLRWILGAAESAPLGGPYALVTAGASMHWMSWPQTLPRVAAAMTPCAYLAIVEHGPRDVPWQSDLLEILRRHTRHQSYDPGFSVTEALSASGLWTIAGRVTTAPVAFGQSVADYIEQFHSTSSLARELMPEEEAAAFGVAVADLVRPYAVRGLLQLAIVADVTWGRITS